MVSVIEGRLWALLRKEGPDFVVMGVSAAVVLTLPSVGVVCFNRVERTLADVV
jgi:hypothetical protein